MISKLSRLLLHSSRDLLSQKSLINEATTNFILLRGMTTQSGNTTTLERFGPRAKIFAPYSIFKGKVALSAEPCPPTFCKLGSGDYKVERRGAIMLKFMPAIGELKYNPEKKQVFALSATELGSLINLGPKDSCEFFHDPSMKSSNAGQVRKSLSVTALDDGSGYFFTLNVVSNVLNTNDRLSVPVTAAEFAVMQTSFAFALPHIMGWDQCTHQPALHPNQSSPTVVPASSISEWDR